MDVPVPGYPVAPSELQSASRPASLWLQRAASRWHPFFSFKPRLSVHGKYDLLLKAALEGHCQQRMNVQLVVGAVIMRLS
ncbi:hypothetical protein BD309DRAFT_992255 [Dichomitus squalens]|uniref:Uncharacterized protein n=2 Tax=Dichomitus squalens TaxID=114155 RepID=A0A4V2JZB6_9APHY|nr:uncharacterized protein DICSQDRAFT_139264 [Dichomitus squalens LYAD-421 SS1]EJF58637.1 hypothetical protein DICSQDRAFT_139264 [Dichomitus squalens LYAD-421 SS1]TBU24453.1 hypothetical protein BD311DRAFT_780999 [Dichomitus squalens]TBU41645.1 hypothetical protein BD309DRAFT_992255 [Dichomitus squalens]TBU55450.1 hypothetical protein BD310DRAFT_950761 [Dichomitus squalens]